jgi:WD40 repeat protein
VLPVTTGLRLTEAARTGPYQLTSYALRGGGTAVRMPGTATFRTLPWTSVSVSPTGRVAVVDTTDATPGGRIGIIDSPAAGTIRWTNAPAPVRNPAWSPDGRKVLVTEFGEQDARLGFEILDTTTWMTQQGDFAQPDPSNFGTFGLHVGWHPSGDVVVGAVELPDDYSGTPKFALRTWTVSGEERGTVPVPGALSASGSQLLSPSGRRAVVSTGRQDITIVDTRSGGNLTTLRLPGQTVYGWVDEGHLVVEGSGGIVLLALDGTTRPYATRTGTTALFGRADITHVNG